MAQTIFRLIALALAVAFAGSVIGGLPSLAQVSLLIVLIVFLWATSIVPEFFGSLVFFALVLVSGVASEAAALAGFQSKAAWLALSGIILGAAIQQHDLGGVLFNRLLRRINSYRTLVWSVATAGLLLSFVVPSSMGRVVMLAPMVLAICDRFGLERGSAGQIGVCLAVFSGTVFPAMAILPSNVPNVVMLGAMEATYGHGITYVDYFVLNFPLLGIGTFLTMTTLAIYLFPASIARLQEDVQTVEWTPQQKKLTAILLATLALWGTDALHGISTAWIGLAAAVVCMTPAIGVVSPKIFNTLNFGPWFFVAGAIGVGGVVRESGLATALWQTISSIIPFGELATALQFGSIVVTTMVIAILATLPATPSIFTPMAAAVAETIGWSVDATILAQIPAFVLFIFPYQAPPIIIGTALLGIPVIRTMKYLAAHTAVGFVLLLPLHYLWGRLIGVFP